MGVQASPYQPFGTLTEEYNGSSWTAGGTSSTGRHATASAGTQTAALGAGGYIGPPVFYGNQTEGVICFAAKSILPEFPVVLSVFLQHRSPLLALPAVNLTSAQTGALQLPDLFLQLQNQ